MVLCMHLPAPFRPTHATREAIETWTVMLKRVGVSLTGYVNSTAFIFISAFPFDLIPSMNDGSGNVNLTEVASISKYERAAGTWFGREGRIA